MFNHGHHKRDFTYIDDIVEGVVRVLDRVARPDPTWDSARPDPGSSRAPYRIYNIGSNRPVDLLRYIEVLEESLGRQVEKIMLPMQPGDVADTFADVSDLIEDVAYKPPDPDRGGSAKLRRLVSRLLSRSLAQAGARPSRIGAAPPRLAATFRAAPGPPARHDIRCAPRLTAPIFVVPIVTAAVPRITALERQMRRVPRQKTDARQCARLGAHARIRHDRYGMPWIGHLIMPRRPRPR